MADGRGDRGDGALGGLQQMAGAADPGDRWCTGQRFAAYRSLLGDAFDGRVLPDSAARPDPPPFFADLAGTPHSVVTARLVDEAGHPTVRARDEILAFLAGRLRPHQGRSVPAPAT
ncbi:hypothetical protein [Streptomyces lavendofoliae]|uniref:hypothetical protein n=1 Tax=Streptomyces lavendofoliae TaxID=67314 RepID=UPI00300F52C0